MEKEYTTHHIANLFNSIARTYDFLNHLLSGGIDFYWRKVAVKFLGNPPPKFILDVACGTADFSIAAHKWGCDSIIGVDISENMLKIAEQKIKNAGLESKIKLKNADAANLPFEDLTFDASIVAFGVRNFTDLEKGLSEIYRVLNHSGKVVILEFSLPKNKLFKALYLFYFKNVLPLVGKIISRHNYAYTYLPSTVLQFPEGEDFKLIMEKTGFDNVLYKPLTFGIVTIYSGVKK